MGGRHRTGRDGRGNSDDLAIRAEFASRSQFDSDFVDSLLTWANGIDGKINRLLIPLCKGITNKEQELRRLRAYAERINKERNAVVHRGEFRNEAESEATIKDVKVFVKGLVTLYKPTFTLAKNDE